MYGKTKKVIISLIFAILFVFNFGLTACGGTPSHEHTITKEIKAVEATCTETGVKAHAYCEICGALLIKENGKYTEAEESSLVLEKIPHVFDRRVESEEYFIAEATADSPQTFVKSCVCGLKSESESDYFTVGKTLKEYEKENKADYEPYSVTLSLYDAENCVYGFNWNIKGKPARPVVEIKEENSENYTRVRAHYDREGTYEYGSSGDKQAYLYYIKAEVELKPNTAYEYRAGDAYLGVFSETVTLKTVSPKESGKWSFAHVSDSQAKGNDDNGDKSGIAFADTLDGILQNDLNRFIVHTGDVVEWSRYESFWNNMLDYNFSRLSVIPTMAISGNHEVDYMQGSSVRSGNGETYKHFNYKIPQQSVKKGIYYSFSYGGAKFIMLNTNELTSEGKLKQSQYDWLTEELKNNSEKWLIVSMHNPMYSVGKWGSDDTKNNVAKKLTEQLGDLFAEYGVDLVLQGHDHMISRTVPIGKGGKGATELTETINGIEYSVNPEGTVYVMNGPAGNQAKGTDAIFSHDESLYVYAEQSYQSSWAEIEIEGNMLTVHVKRVQNKNTENIKSWGIKK